MRPRLLQSLTWATVAAAILSALWLAWSAEAGHADGAVLTAARAAPAADEPGGHGLHAPASRPGGLGGGLVAPRQRTAAR